MFITGIPQYPVERTLLTTGILDAVMHSRAKGGIKIKTEHLAELTYQSYHNKLYRPTAPRTEGATLVKTFQT